MTTERFEYLALSKIQCPRCGTMREIPLHANTEVSLEYAGVCQAELDDGRLCDISFTLEVTAHAHPAQASS